MGCDPTVIFVLNELSMAENTVTLPSALFTTYILVAPTPVVLNEPAMETGAFPTGTAPLTTVPTDGITLTSLDILFAIYRLPFAPTPAATCPVVLTGRAAVVIADKVGSSAIYRVAVLSPLMIRARPPPLARNMGLAPTVTTPTLVSPEVLICIVLPLPVGLVERTT